MAYQPITVVHDQVNPVEASGGRAAEDARLHQRLRRRVNELISSVNFTWIVH